jgi:hypothetical protein
MPITYQPAYHVPTCLSRTNLPITYQPAYHIPTCLSHTNLPITGTRPLAAPNNTWTTQSSHQTGTTHASKHPLPIHQTRKTCDADTSPAPRRTHLHTTFAYTHEVPTRFTTHYTTKKTSRLISTISRLLQSDTPNAITRGFCSPGDGHNDARNMLRQKLIINIQLLHLVCFSFSLFKSDFVFRPNGRVHLTFRRLMSTIVDVPHR